MTLRSIRLPVITNDHHRQSSTKQRTVHSNLYSRYLTPNTAATAPQRALHREHCTAASNRIIIYIIVIYGVLLRNIAPLYYRSYYHYSEWEGRGNNYNHRGTGSQGGGCFLFRSESIRFGIKLADMLRVWRVVCGCDQCSSYLNFVVSSSVDCGGTHHIIETGRLSFSLLTWLNN